MLKIIFISLTFLFSITLASAQKSFEVTIKLDSSIKPQNVHYSYYNGKIKTFLPDTFGSKREVVLKSRYYSPFACFYISYTDPTHKNYYNNDFFVTDKPATISFYAKANHENKLEYTTIKNAIPIYDTNANRSWARMHHFLMDTAMYKENVAFDYFLDHNKGFSKSDSLTRIFRKFYKTRLNRIMVFLKLYPDDYFSFWYFLDQVAQPNGVLSKDTAYLKEQLAYLKTVFPAKYTESIEGKELIKSYEAVIKPAIKLNGIVAPFNITTIDGKKIKLSDLKGKYVLLDFWATWCAPCMADIPFIKEIRKNNSLDKLIIIGISADIDIKRLNATIKKEGMDWSHFYDQNKEIVQLYGIDAFPTLILINKEGKMIYRSDHVKNDKETLPKILEGLN